MGCPEVPARSVTCEGSRTKASTRPDRSAGWSSGRILLVRWGRSDPETTTSIKNNRSTTRERVAARTRSDPDRVLGRHSVYPRSSLASLGWVLPAWTGRSGKVTYREVPLNASSSSELLRSIWTRVRTKRVPAGARSHPDRVPGRHPVNPRSSPAQSRLRYPARTGRPGEVGYRGLPVQARLLSGLVAPHYDRVNRGADGSMDAGLQWTEPGGAGMITPGERVEKKTNTEAKHILGKWFRNHLLSQTSAVSRNRRYFFNAKLAPPKIMLDFEHEISAVRDSEHWSRTTMY